MYTVEVYTVEMYAVEMYTVEMYASEMHVFEMCMPLKCMSLRSMSLDQSTKLSSVWIFPFHNVAKSLSQICYVPTVARGGARKKGVPEGFSFISVR